MKPDATPVRAFFVIPRADCDEQMQNCPSLYSRDVGCVRRRQGKVRAPL